jgi:hypothetical protein
MNLFKSIPDFDLSTPRDGKHISKTRDIAFIALLVFKNASSGIGMKETWADRHYSYSIDGNDAPQIPSKALTTWLGRRYWGFRRAFNHSGITPKGYEYALEGMVRSPRTMMGQIIETFGKSLSWSFTGQGDPLGGQTIATNLYRWVGSSWGRDLGTHFCPLCGIEPPLLKATIRTPTSGPDRADGMSWSFPVCAQCLGTIRG